MDSPESTTRGDTAVNATDVASNSPQVQESPFSNFVSSFSPLEFKNVSRMSHGFLGLSSPPLIFTTPRVNPDRESNFLPRSQNAELSTGEASQEDARLNKPPQGTGDWDNSHLGLPESSGVNNCEHIQHSSSSEQVDKYLADPVEGECSDYLIDQNLKQLELGFQISKANASIATDSQGLTIEPENRSVEKAEDDASNVLSKIGEPEPKELVLFDGRQTENKEGESTSELKHGRCIAAEFQYNSKFSSFINGGSGDSEEINLPSEMASEPMQNAQALEDCPNAAEPILNRSVSNMMLDSELNEQQIQMQVNQQHRGMSRRCLQFEEALPKAAISTSFPQASRDANFSKSASTSAECNTFDSNASFCSRQLINVSQPMNNSSSHPDNGKLIFPLAKPSGIGLHLNSIVKTVPIGCDATFKISDGSMSIQEMKSEATAENKTIVEASGSPICESLQAFEALMQTVDEHATPHDKRKFSPEYPNNIEHCIDQNPKSKKKKLSDDPDDDGCKRCNCKKTKCLKLYCDCFAAGIYCDDTCSCQGCLNRVEHAETVLETRRQIESRNPLAFAPKIVQRVSEFPTKNMGDENLTTPSSARHKRGCNCKKSMCTKKYCECYQGNVGCSSGCRCENCQNVYGKKDDYVPEELMSSRVVVEKSEFDDNMDIVVTKKNSAQAHLGNNMHKLTPITPSFGYLDHGKGGPKSQIIIRRFHPSHSTTQRNPDEEIPTEVPQTGFEHPPSRFGSVINASNITSASLGGSLCWRSKKSPEFTDSDAELMNILENYDETPEISMEGSTKTPTKISSPSRKRVSPLKQQRLRKEMGSSSSNTSSGPLRSGRKFVLRGVPSFPPLTPCAESKILVKQQQQQGSADSQQSGDDKP